MKTGFTVLTMDLHGQPEWQTLREGNTVMKIIPWFLYNYDYYIFQKFYLPTY